MLRCSKETDVSESVLQMCYLTLSTSDGILLDYPITVTVSAFSYYLQKECHDSATTCTSLYYIVRAGNTRVVSQSALQNFQEEMKKAKSNPYNMILRPTKLPITLLNESQKVGGWLAGGSVNTER